MKENQYHLYFACKASKGNFEVHSFQFLFWNKFREKNSFVFAGMIS